MRAFTNGRGYSGICIGLQFVGNASKSFPLCFQLCKYFFAGKIRDFLGRRGPWLRLRLRLLLLLLLFPRLLTTSTGRGGGGGLKMNKRSYRFA